MKLADRPRSLRERGQAGDALRALREGRQCARAVDEWLMGSSMLPR